MIEQMLLMAKQIEGAEWFYLIASIVLLLAAIVLVVIILIQSNSSKGLSGAIAGGSDTFYGRNKGKSIDKKLMIVTIVVTVLFAILTLAIFSIQTNSKTINEWWEGLIGGNTTTDTSTSTDVEESTDTSAETTTDDANQSTDSE